MGRRGIRLWGRTMRNIAFGIVIFPGSWRLGVWRREKKDILSIGPVRFVLYKDPGQWKPAEALIARSVAPRPPASPASPASDHVITAVPIGDVS